VDGVTFLGGEPDSEGHGVTFGASFMTGHHDPGRRLETV
jgi:hypothetical protein